MLWNSFLTQRRVIGALIIREVYTRFGRENLGFMWVVAEPLVFAFPVLGMWSLIRSPYERGLAAIPLLWSGYLPILLFRHAVGRALSAVRQNAGLLYHRNVTPFDIFVARVGLEVIGNFAAVVLSFAPLFAIGALDWPRNLPLFYLGYFYMAWWSVALALIVGGLSERTEIVEKIWAPIGYIYLPVSGFFYLADWLPPAARPWALLMPSLQSYEMIRGGVFGDAVRVYYDPAYTAFICATLTLIGLVLMRGARKYVVLE